MRDDHLHPGMLVPAVAQLDVLDHRPFIDTQQRTP
jgi:hypothetical protein